MDGGTRKRGPASAATDHGPGKRIHQRESIRANGRMQPCGNGWPASHEESSCSPLLLTARDVARELSISVRSVFRMAASQQLPAEVRVGQRRRWRRAEMMAWIDAGLPPRDEWEKQGGAM